MKHGGSTGQESVVDMTSASAWNRWIVRSNRLGFRPSVSGRVVGGDPLDVSGLCFSPEIDPQANGMLLKLETPLLQDQKRNQCRVGRVTTSEREWATVRVNASGRLYDGDQGKCGAARGTRPRGSTFGSAERKFEEYMLALTVPGVPRPGQRSRDIDNLANLVPDVPPESAHSPASPAHLQQLSFSNKKGTAPQGITPFPAGRSTGPPRSRGESLHTQTHTTQRRCRLAVTQFGAERR